MKSGCSLWAAEIETLKQTEKDLLEYFCESTSTPENRVQKLEIVYTDIDTLLEKIETSIKVNLVTFN